MKKILVIDDSTLMRRVMSDIINSTNEYRVEYTAANGVDGLAILEAQDDITAVFCDVVMPRMTGLELLQVVRYKGIRVPFVMISSSHDAKNTIAALELGAMEFIKKPEKILGKKNHIFRERVLNALDMASGLKEKMDSAEDVMAASQNVAEDYSALNVSKVGTSNKKSRKKRIDSGRKLVALVCSTGGPKALQSVIPKLPSNLAAPVVIVQHMPAGFTGTLSGRLNELSRINVKEAVDKEPVENGTVYIAKGGIHLTLTEENGSVRIAYDDSPPVVGLKPCGNIMYSSLCDLPYDEIICVVLTGMGADGTKGILELSKSRKLYVIAQDEASSTVYGMPRAVYESGLTDCVSDIQLIADEIVKKVGVL